MQTCDPRLITRPDVFAYGRAIPEVAGWYDYRICYRQSATERLRTLQALSWSWRPYSCAMRPIDGAAFDAWLGKRTLLFLGDSLNAQMYYSLSWLLGDSIAEHKDLFGYETPGANRTERKMDTCTTGVGNEGGWLSTATLRGGGRLVKVMRHGDLIDEMKRMEKAFWAPWLQEADIVVLNVGHHYHSKDPTFGKYPKLVRTTMNQLGKLIKPSAQLIYRTTNVGHHKCENASRPLRSRLAAWEKLTETGTSVWEWNTRKSARRPEPRRRPEPPPIPRSSFSHHHSGRLDPTAQRHCPRRRPPRAAPPPRSPLLSRSGASAVDLFKDKYNWRGPPMFEVEWAAAAARAPDRWGGRFTVLNVSFMDARADGHVAASQRYSSMHGRFGADWKRNFPLDCLHYCYPGPSDYWAKTLYNLLMNNAKFAAG